MLFLEEPVGEVPRKAAFLPPVEVAQAEVRSERARKRGVKAYLIVRRAPSEDVSPRSPGRRYRRRGISPTGSQEVNHVTGRSYGIRRNIGVGR
jgi:hypothetical protein